MSANRGGANEIKVGDSTIKSFGYDAAGRTTSVMTGAGTTTLAYDYESRITTITYPNTSTNTFTYNGLDTRVGKVDSGGTKTYKRDGVGVTAPVISDGAASYTPGLSERRSGTSTFSHAGIKNQHEQTAANESSTATQTYDAFGNLVGSSGTWKGPFGYGGSFGYQTDGDSGLKLLGHRYYDSSTGRFMTPDSLKSGRNWYCYADSNPIVRADPLGDDWHMPPYDGDVYNNSSGSIIVVGEPGPGRAQIAVLLPPGHRDPDNFDADEMYYKGKWYHLSHASNFWQLTTGGSFNIDDGGIHARKGQATLQHANLSRFLDASPGGEPNYKPHPKWDGVQAFIREVNHFFGWDRPGSPPLPPAPGKPPGGVGAGEWFYKNGQWSNPVFA